MGYYNTSDGKLVPRQKTNWHPKATTPAAETEVDRPMKIYITSSMTTIIETVSFKFGSGSAYIPMGNMAAGLYDLQPIAWKNTSGAQVVTGAIVFIYGGK